MIKTMIATPIEDPEINTLQESVNYWYGLIKKQLEKGSGRLFITSCNTDDFGWSALSHSAIRHVACLMKDTGEYDVRHEYKHECHDWYFEKKVTVPV